MIKDKVKSYPVAPDSVYVWRGFKAPQKSYADFSAFLGTVFVPACALLQPKVGLRAYIPTLLPDNNKPPAVPDQTALMFWDTPQSHNLANEALAVRIYQNLHGDAYDMTRSSLPEIPKPLPSASAEFVVEQPYYFFDNLADWMLGQTMHVVGARPIGMDSKSFQTQVYQWAAGFKTTVPKDVDGALICCGNDYAAVWVHAKENVPDFAVLLNGFASLLDVQLFTTPRSLVLPAGLWNKWEGLDLTQADNTSLNIQLKRPKETIPVK